MALLATQTAWRTLAASLLMRWAWARPCRCAYFECLLLSGSLVHCHGSHATGLSCGIFRAEQRCCKVRSGSLHLCWLRTGRRTQSDRAHANRTATSKRRALIFTGASCGMDTGAAWRPRWQGSCAKGAGGRAIISHRKLGPGDQEVARHRRGVPRAAAWQGRGRAGALAKPVHVRRSG